MTRVPGGRWVDAARPIPFTFDGKELMGLQGDTIASALLANGVRIVARSFKRHRPRGILAAGMEEPSAYLRVEDERRIEVNALATRTRLAPGMRVSGLHAWPSVAFDAGAIADRFAALMPAGFYYKTFLWPSWKVFERSVRAAAGLDKLPLTAPRSRVLNRHTHCDVLVVGAGPAGLSAARSCAEAGLRVVVLDARRVFGGWLAWAAGEHDAAATAWVEEQVQALRACHGVTLLSNTMAIGYYDHNLVAAIESFDLEPGREGRPDQRLWQIRARQVILATGSVERPLVFPGNDLPGVMLANSALEYLRGYGVAVARRAVVFTNNDSAYLAARELKRSGVEIAALVDVRERPGELAAQLVRQQGIDIVAAGHVSRARGRARVHAVDVGGGASRRIECDALLVSGGWNPQVQLFAHCGGKLRYDERTASFVPAHHSLGCLCAGGINGHSLPEDIAADAARAAATALARLGREKRGAVRVAPMSRLPAEVRAWWSPPGDHDRNDAWVDLHSDVTQADIALAVRENYASVEHLKRYTTLGMGPDQGRTANVNGLAILAQALGKDIADSGTTRFRPPVVGASLATLAASMQGDLYAPKRELPAHDRHAGLGARLQDYSGWQRPAWYARGPLTREACIEAECRAVRERAGIFDSSPLGKLEVHGPDAEDFLSRIYANAIRSLKPGGVRYGVMLLETGYLLDDGVVARLAPDHFLVGPSSGAAQRVLGWMEEWLQTEWPGLRVAIVDVTSTWASFSIAGPAARDVVLRAGTDIGLSPAEFPHMALRTGRVAGIRARVQRVSFSGELQYEISVPAAEAARVMDALLAAGEAAQMEPVGLDAWLRLRIDKGYLHIGTDTDGTTTPDDVGLAGMYSKKEEDFIGRRSLSRPALRAPDREQLVGLRVTDGNVPLTVGACVLAQGADRFPCAIAGHVTSSAFSVALGRPVALARLRNGRDRVGERVALRDARGMREAQVCGTVPYDPDGARLRV